MKDKCPECGAECVGIIAGTTPEYACGSRLFPESHGRKTRLYQSDQCKINALTAEVANLRGHRSFLWAAKMAAEAYNGSLENVEDSVKTLLAILPPSSHKSVRDAVAAIHKDLKLVEKCLSKWRKAMEGPFPRMQVKMDKLKSENTELRAALHELADWQNGPPLQTQKYIDGWNAARTEAGRLLGWPEPKCGKCMDSGIHTFTCANEHNPCMGCPRLVIGYPLCKGHPNEPDVDTDFCDCPAGQKLREDES